MANTDRRRRTNEWARQTVLQVVLSAAGRENRDDPVTSRTGGPAGNARLTAWLGAILLPLMVVEVFTLAALHQLIGWHIALGVALVPLVLAKTATTGWRILRYYTGSAAYRQAGPPPLLLRALGPLVVLTSFAVLGTGVALIALGRDGSRQSVAVVLGHPVDAVAVHKLAFAAWLVAVAAHVLARLLPSLRIIFNRVGSRVPGRLSRSTAIVSTLAAAAIAAPLVLGASSSWTSGFFDRFEPGHFAHDDEH